MALVARLVLIFALAVAAVPAAAQGWFGNLFGAPPPRPGAPAYPGYGGGGYGGYRGGGYGGGGYGYAPQRSDNDFYRPPPRRHVQKRKPAPAPVEEEASDAPKEAPKPAKNASLFVDVFGDSLGQMLADGLDDALADRDDVAVIHKAKGSTGLVASDYYDWPKSIDDLLAGREGKDAAKEQPKDASKEAPKDNPIDAKAADKPAKDKPPKIDVAVMMVGSNDKQAIREDGKTLTFGTPEWTTAYTKRVTRIDEAFKAHGIPLIWVGVPITKDDNFADAMASLNDVTREAAAKTGATFVDTWEAFSDDDGDFSAYGPDINGQTVRLRASDGIHFTKAGARKLAHFVETHVRRALDGKTPAPQLPTGDASAGKPTAAAKPDAGPIRNLVDVPEAKGGQLAALPPRRPDERKPDAKAQEFKVQESKPQDDKSKDTALVRGETQPVPPGRADDARWPPQGVPEP